MSFIRAHKIEISIFLLALVTRLLYLGLSFQAANGDLIAVLNRGDGYFDIAQNLISGHGYSILHAAPYTPTAYRTPGLPYFILWSYALFRSFWAVILLQIVLGSIIPILGMRLARYITPSWWIGVVVGIFLAIEPTSVLFSTQLLSETLFMFAFSLSLLCLFRYWKSLKPLPLLVSAWLLGLSVLVRPSVEYLPSIIVALMLWQARRHLSRATLARALLFVLVFLATLSPWLYRNYKTFGVVGLSSQQGTQIYTIAVPSVLAIANHTSFAQEYNNEIAGPNDANFEQSNAYMKLALPILLSHPRAFALMGTETMFSFFTYDGTYDVLRKIGLEGDLFSILSHAKQASGLQPGTPTLLLLSRPLVLARYLVAIAATPLALILIGRVAWLFITLLFFAGAWHSLRRSSQPIYALAAVAIIFYLALTSIFVGFTINYRYRMPVNSLIVTFAALDVTVLAGWARKKFHAN